MTKKEFNEAGLFFTHHKDPEIVYLILKIDGLIQYNEIWEPCVYYTYAEKYYIWSTLSESGKANYIDKKPELFHRPISEFLEKFKPYENQ